MDKQQIFENPEDRARLDALRQAGTSWPQEDTEAAGAAGADSELTVRSVRAGSHLGDRYVRVQRTGQGVFRRIGDGDIRATAAVPRALGTLGRIGIAIKTVVVGDPLANERLSHERLTKVKALAVLSSDAISSVAYATGAMLSVLLAVGTANFGISIWIGLAIAILFAMVVLSYRQTIKMYPKGGGSYIVASDNLGSLAGLIAGSSLMIDYVLTVAVSVVSGVSALTSMSPELAPYAVALDVGFIVLVLFGNLRGIRESGTLFMLPSYAFIAGIYVMIAVGTVRFLHNGAHVMPPATVVHATESMTLFLVLRAFASGCTALTGVEAISDGVPAFQAPEWRNARITITTLGILAISMFMGITLLVHAFGLVPTPGDNPPTLISQLNSTALGNGIGYYYVQITTALILMLAANTAFSDFPRLAFFMARDGFLPHQFRLRGDRLSYSNGILVLGALALLLVLVFQGSFASLVNLYVIGVFASFTLSQSGMVHRWWTRHEEGWRKGILLNGTGAVLTFVVLLITAVTKFIYGAWMVVLLVPLMVISFYRIRAHYRRSGEALQPHAVAPPSVELHTVVIAAEAEEGFHAAHTYLRIMRARQMVAAAEDVPATDGTPDGMEPVEEMLLDGRTTATALLATVERLKARGPAETVTVVLPISFPDPWHHLARRRLRRKLLRRGAVVIHIAPGLAEETIGRRHTTLVSVATLNQAGLDALAYARTFLSGKIFGVNVATQEDREWVRAQWEAWGNHVPLVVIESPYRAIVGPLRAYIDALAQREGDETITLVLPVVIAKGVLGKILHNHTANRLRRMLLDRPNTVVISVPHVLA